MMYPDDSMQPGPIYSSQVDYLVDETILTDKGANCVISYLHHYLAQFGKGEKDMHLHADNCAGQKSKWARGSG